MLDHFEDAFRVADAHEIAGFLGRKEVGGPGGRLEHDRARLADREAAERVAVEVDRGDLVDGAVSEVGVRGALGDAEEELPGRALGLVLSLRPERREADGFDKLFVR